MNSGKVTTGYATGDVNGASNVGGLVGKNQDTVIASYATGIVTGVDRAGGLIGVQGDEGTTTDRYWDTDTSGQSTSADGTGKTTTDMRSPITYTGIYENWEVDIDGDDNADDPWDFGTDQQYPVLKVDFNNDNDATWQEFGNQRNPPGPRSITSIATYATNQLTITWSAPEWDGGSDISSYDFRHIRSYSSDMSDEQWTVIVGAAGADSLQANIIGLEEGNSYDIQVRAVNSIGQRQWLETSVGKPNEAPSLVEIDFIRSVPENSLAGTDVGVPIEAEYRDGDDITFS